MTTIAAATTSTACSTADRPPASAANTNVYLDLRTLIPGNYREVGNQAIWILSSCKSGYGVEQIRDDNTDTYWQSDGPQPHLVNILFRRKTPVTYLAVYTDIKADESYTPNRICVRAGTHASDLSDIVQMELKERVGWTAIALTSDNNNSGENADTNGTVRPLRTFMIQLAVLQNHQNGRDTHIRQIKIFGPGNSRSDADPLSVFRGYDLL